MRAVVAALLALTACAKEPRVRPGGGDVGSFCGMPSDICDHPLVDEQGRVIVPRMCVDAGRDVDAE
jgi:hypothetical protein